MAKIGAKDYIDLTITGYEFPDKETELKADLWDVNWVNVHLKARKGRAVWEGDCPCLQTSDVYDLAVWFSGLATGKRIKRNLHFTENALEFKRKGDIVEAHLGWRFSLNGKKAILEIPIKKDECLAFAIDLMRYYLKFPPRGVEDYRTNVFLDLLIGLDDLKKEREGKIKLKRTKIVR